MGDLIRALALGDIVGKPGCRALFLGLAALVKKYKADLVIANGENAAEGFGMTPEIAEELFRCGVDVITTGNHIWQKREILPVLESEQRLLRPENYPAGVPGRGHCMVMKREIAIGILNLQGRVHLTDLSCPFRAGKEGAKRLRGKTPLILVDFHAESAEEKEALGLYLDGSVSAVLGTHTHVQTADEKILPGGTAYLTDLGMTGPSDSIIGMKPESSIQRCLTQIPVKMEVKEGPAVIQGVCLELDAKTGKALAIERLHHAVSM